MAALPVLLVAEPLTALHRRGLFLPNHGHDAYDRIINMLVGPLLTAAIVGAVAIAGRWLDHRPFADFGARVDRVWWRGLALGLGLGAFVMSLVFAFEWAVGWITVSGLLVTTAPGLSLGLGLAFTLVKVTCVATYEEFFSRGYQLRNLIEATNRPLGVALSSAIFALLHFSNENVGVLSIIGLCINGVLFATAVLATGRLSTAIGLHLTWNLFEGAVFGFPVSGDKEGASMVGIQQLGPGFVTGGSFGPEAGLIGIAASLLGIIVLVLIHRHSAPRS
jgi:membrane protease YdiL (CAAX protease family)